MNNPEYEAPLEVSDQERARKIFIKLIAGLEHEITLANDPTFLSQFKQGIEDDLTVLEQKGLDGLTLSNLFWPQKAANYFVERRHQSPDDKVFIDSLAESAGSNESLKKAA